jgi:TRL-like protein family
MSTTTLIKLATGAAFAMIAIGCGYGYPVGSLYTGTQVPHGINRNETSGAGKTGDKAGEACATGILSAVAFGDASLDAAKKAGGISEIHSVEFHGTNILGIYSQGCTEVHGK